MSRRIEGTAMTATRNINSNPPGMEGITLTWLEPDKLRPLGRRTRTHSRKQIGQIAESILTFGFSVPILVDEQQRILAGNARLEAARVLGLEQVPVVVVSHLDPAQKRAFVIAENRLAELAGWDRSVLKAELQELAELDLAFDLDVIGFDDAAIDALVLCDEDGGGADAVPDAPQTAATRLGDLWALGDHRLLCGNALETASLETVLGDEQAQAIFTDPPYNCSIPGFVTKSGQHAEFAMASGEMSSEEFTAFLGCVWDQAARARVPGGLAYMCMDWRNISPLLQGCDQHGFELLNLIVWDKVQGGMGSFYRSRHELIFLARKPGAPHTNRIELGKHGRDRTNVWAYPGMSGAGHDQKHLRSLHPTVKPAIMVRDALLDSTGRGDIVLDFFAGSGTIFIAAEMARRRARAIELEPRYCDVVINRWESFTGKEARLSSTGQTFAEARADRAITTAAGGI